MKRLIICLLGLAPIAACATPVPAVEIPGVDEFAAPCEGSPQALSDDEVRALLARYPDAETREQEHWIPQWVQLRRYALCERSRADRAVNNQRRFNERVRGDE